VKVFVDLTRFAASATRGQLRDRVRQLEDVGATGVTVSDHIFFTSAGRPRTDGVGHGCDPLTTVAAVAGLSDRLEVQTVVMNTAWMHPGLLLRQFAQLAVLLGGERVTAGLGAGWSAEEFDALGLAMPRFRDRIDRLEEVLRVARGLWTDGLVTNAGRHVVARDLPLSPVPDRSPRLLVGGGSDRLLELAGRFADLLDLHGDPRHGRVAGATMAQAAAGDVARRAHTTVDDLAGRIELVREAARAAGRARGRRRRRHPDLVRGVRLGSAGPGGGGGAVRVMGLHPVPAAGPEPLHAARQSDADGRGVGGAPRGLRPGADLAQRGGWDCGCTAGPAPVLPRGAAPAPVSGRTTRGPVRGRRREPS
jgi:alkanesulfonate monooxygenase SsuD/methylene tetrahydromethanopterin reductase-like flavin-dependent oxidoreductase (luciferase family)